MKTKPPVTMDMETRLHQRNASARATSSPAFSTRTQSRSASRPSSSMHCCALAPSEASNCRSSIYKRRSDVKTPRTPTIIGLLSLLDHLQQSKREYGLVALVAVRRIHEQRQLSLFEGQRVTTPSTLIDQVFHIQGYQRTKRYHLKICERRTTGLELGEKVKHKPNEPQLSCQLLSGKPKSRYI